MKSILELLREEESLVKTYNGLLQEKGSDNEVTINASARIRQFRGQILMELTKMMGGIKND